FHSSHTSNIYTLSLHDALPISQKLAESGIESGTLQRHLVRKEQAEQKRLYILDESSLASTKQMNDFLHRLHNEDRVILVGDKRRSEEHTSELQSHLNLVCRLLL